MFIPNYQIHNILKDFTHRLKYGNHRQDAGHRLETIVNKVADTIMDRVTRLSEEEARRKADATGIHAHPSPPPANEQQSGVFHYHTIGKDHHKTIKSLAVENPAHLIDRFQSVIDEAADVVPEE